MKNQKGFSLIEVLVATAILGAAAIGFMRLSENITKAEVRMNDNLSFGMISENIRIKMAVKDSCKNTINRNFTTLDPFMGGIAQLTLTNLKGNGIELSNGLFNVDKLLMKVGGDKVGPFEVESIKLKVDKDQFPDSGDINNEMLLLFYSLKKEGKFHYRKIGKLQFPVKGSIQNGKLVITECGSSESELINIITEQVTQNVMEVVCQNSNMTYDSVSNSCTSQPTQTNQQECPLINGERVCPERPTTLDVCRDSSGEITSCEENNARNTNRPELNQRVRREFELELDSSTDTPNIEGAQQDLQQQGR